jgi:DNA-binding LacI/PurR family transcriptional regulator
VSGGTRQHVINVMNETGYRPNGAARALKRGSFRTIGVITFAQSPLANMCTLEAIASRAARQGFATTLIPITASTKADIQGAFSRMGELAVDAVIAIIESHLLEGTAVTLPPAVKVLVVDSEAGGQHGVVATDQAGGIQKAVQHLLDLGHETVWLVGGPEGSSTGERRSTAWRNTLTAAGRPTPTVVRGDWSASSGYAAGLRLADEAECTAVFAANDHMALGLLRALHEKGKSVPGEISLIGFDDVPEASSYAPPLTTVQQGFAEIGARCVDSVLKQLDGNDTEAEIALIPTELVIRESTAPPNKLTPHTNLRQTR